MRGKQNIAQDLKVQTKTKSCLKPREKLWCKNRSDILLLLAFNLFACPWETRSIETS